LIFEKTLAAIVQGVFSQRSYRNLINGFLDSEGKSLASWAGDHNVDPKALEFGSDYRMADTTYKLSCIAVDEAAKSKDVDEAAREQYAVLVKVAAEHKAKLLECKRLMEEHRQQKKEMRSFIYMMMGVQNTCAEAVKQRKSNRGHLPLDGDLCTVLATFVDDKTAFNLCE